ncbi:MAG: acetyl-CoA C-acetyltransferase [Sphingomonadales bacterium]|jgi:acetyl-CoA C-acetyltransferase
MTDVYIYDTVRTPRGRGKPDGKLHEITPMQLAAQMLKSIRDRNDLDTSKVDDVIMGCVAPVGEQGADIARIATLMADYDQSVAGVQINRFCASGLEAVNMATAKVMCGQSDMAIGGGVESMSRVPMGADGGAWATDPAVAFKTYFIPQGISADLIASKWGYSRDDVDAYAIESQKRAAKSWEEKRFSNSVVGVKDVAGMTVLNHDEHMRPEATIQSLAGLKPSFEMMGNNYGFNSTALQKYPEVEKINHVHHAGNSSGIVDGASMVLVGNKYIGEAMGLKPKARIKGFAQIGSEPTIMLTGPSYAAEKALVKCGMNKSDIDLWELNEAFAAVVLRFMEELDIDHGDINVCGGAIAMGHPLGATGAMILGTAVDELIRSGKETALTTLCIGGGMGVATIIERV